MSKTCTVRFDNNKYSVVSTAVGRPVEVHAYAERIVIRQDGVIVGEHARAFGVIHAQEKDVAPATVAEVHAHGCGFVEDGEEIRG